VDTGLGKGMPGLPSVALVRATHEIKATGEELIVDGVRLIFQITPGTEAPAEMNIYIPEERALCMAENCTANQHNVYTLRGAQVRDALSGVSTSTSRSSSTPTSATCSSRVITGPVGREDLSEYLASQRDAYRYVHDQTLRLANHGLDDDGNRRGLVLPAGLGDQFSIAVITARFPHNAKRCTSATSDGSTGIPLTSIHIAGRSRKEITCHSWAGAEAVLERARASFARR